MSDAKQKKLQIKITMLEEYLIDIIRDGNIENICIESSEDKTKWYFTCYIGQAYSEKSQEVWIEGTNPFEVLEKALLFIDRFKRGCHVGGRKSSKWDGKNELDKEIVMDDIL